MKRRLVGPALLLAATLCISGDILMARQPASMDETITFFYYEDIESAAGFYEDLLHLRKTMDEDWVKIYQITPTSSVGLVQEGRGFHPVSADKPAMLSIVTNDVDAWYKRLADSGAAMRRKLPPPGDDTVCGDAPPVRGFIVEDPGGYTVEFFSWQDSSR